MNRFQLWSSVTKTDAVGMGTPLDEGSATMKGPSSNARRLHRSFGSSNRCWGHVAGKLEAAKVEPAICCCFFDKNLNSTWQLCTLSKPLQRQIYPFAWTAKGKICHCSLKLYKFRDPHCTSWCAGEPKHQHFWLVETRTGYTITHP